MSFKALSRDNTAGSDHEDGAIMAEINITPLNRIGSSGIGGVGEKGGTITLDVWLSPDLEARVRDSTLNDVADIMLDIQRRR